MTLQTWFTEPGAYVLVDGQFGSTGKGLLAGFLAEVGKGRITHVTTNAGPNSGHTAYYDNLRLGYPATSGPAQKDGLEDMLRPRYERVMTQQLPVAGVFLNKLGAPVPMFLNAGAIIDPDILSTEVFDYVGFVSATGLVVVHPNAAIIRQEHRDRDAAVTKSIAGTGKGIGPALMDKISRLTDNIAEGEYGPLTTPDGVEGWDNMWDWSKDVVFVETAQGFSLGVNRQFHPKCTSRECTVMQAIADASIPAQMVKKVAMTLRTFPIRVGDTEGSSGRCYPDQREISWDDIGVEPELTTVTKRVRRVFTWSREQFRDAVAANRPDMLFLNFANYLAKPELASLVAEIRTDYRTVMGREIEDFLIGFGPHTTDVCTVEEALGANG